MQLNSRITVPSLDTVTDTISAPMSGTLTQIIMHFPPGCLSYVEVSVNHGGKNICPSTGSIALDNATPPFQIHEEVMVGDPIIITYTNHDDTYDHTISVILTLIKKDIMRL